MGSITAEMFKMDDKQIKLSKMLDYVSFSIISNKVPDALQDRIKRYIHQKHEIAEIGQELNDFMTFLNPAMSYEVDRQFKFKILRDFWMFEKAHQNELMFIVSLLEGSLCSPGEKIIQQGEKADKLYMIMFGNCDVFINKQFTIATQVKSKLKAKSKKVVSKLNKLKTLRSLE